MRQHAVDFYGDLFRKEKTNGDCLTELLQGPPQLRAAVWRVLDATISMEELTAAVTQMAPCRAPGLDGLPADFYKHFWSWLGAD